MQPEEVVQGEFMPVTEILSRLGAGNLNPDALPILEHLKKICMCLLSS